MQSAQKQYELGIESRDQGEREKAVEYFEAAVNIDPGHYQSYAAAAEIFMEQGLSLQAMDCYGCAISVRPFDSALKEKFIGLARACRFVVFNPQMKALLLLCLQDKSVDFSFMGEAWHSLLASDPVFKPVYKALQKKDYASFKKAFSKLSDHKALLEPVFIMALRRPILIPDMEFETFLTHLRRALLEGLIENAKLAEALSHYCHYTDYVFACGDEEKAKLADNGNDHILSCYKPARQTKATAPIPSLTGSDNEVSAKVKAQYEESPYPRWSTYTKQIYNETIEGRLRDNKARILVAGCGTGREAIELAHVFPDANVLGLDLSYASLSYGAAKAQEFGVRNVEFKQADILKLGNFGERFDYIASTGVLHHMERPEEGWKILTGLLKPGGLMRIGLYSRKSREPIRAAQRIIQDKKFSSSAEDIRRFRDESQKLLKKNDYKKIASYIDFYTLPTCRDLLFHVHEHDFTLDEIGGWIERAGMKFLGFNIAADILAAYREANPGDPEAANLDLWARFEEKNPDAFTGMYRMWLQKN